MIVTLGATYRKAQPDSTCGGCPIDDVLKPELLVIDTSFTIRESVPVETSGDPLLDRSVRQQIAGKLFDGELGQKACQR